MLLPTVVVDVLRYLATLVEEEEASLDCAESVTAYEPHPVVSSFRYARTNPTPYPLPPYVLP